MIPSMGYIVAMGKICWFSRNNIVCRLGAYHVFGVRCHDLNLDIKVPVCMDLGAETWINSPSNLDNIDAKTYLVKNALSQTFIHSLSNIIHSHVHTVHNTNIRSRLPLRTNPIPPIGNCPIWNTIGPHMFSTRVSLKIYCVSWICTNTRRRVPLATPGSLLVWPSPWYDLGFPGVPALRKTFVQCLASSST